MSSEPVGSPCKKAPLNPENAGPPARAAQPEQAAIVASQIRILRGLARAAAAAFRKQLEKDPERT